jgi:uncharacterized membrane protein YhaH (DUF805 family)
VKHFILALTRYADFAGRSTRAEYWYFALFFALIYWLLLVGDHLTGTLFESGDLGALSGAFLLLMAIPSLAVGARRLHDVGMSGWWQLINFVPVIGFLMLLFWTLRDGQVGANAYGPDPKGRTA